MAGTPLYLARLDKEVCKNSLDPGSKNDDSIRVICRVVIRGFYHKTPLFEVSVDTN